MMHVYVHRQDLQREGAERAERSREAEAQAEGRRGAERGRSTGRGQKKRHYVLAGWSLAKPVLVYIPGTFFHLKVSTAYTYSSSSSTAVTLYERIECTAVVCNTVVINIISCDH